MKRKPVTEWAGMTDWGMAGRKWKRGSGEGDNWWEVAKKEQQFGSRSIGIRCIALSSSDHDRVAELACSIKSIKPLERLAIW